MWPPFFIIDFILLILVGKFRVLLEYSMNLSMLNYFTVTVKRLATL